MSPSLRYERLFIPNGVDLFTIFHVDQDIKAYIRENYKDFFLLFFPVYKHIWYNKFCVRDRQTGKIYLQSKNEHITINQEIFDIDQHRKALLRDLQLDPIFLEKENNIQCGDFLIDLTAYAFLYIRIFDNITQQNMSFLLALSLLRNSLPYGFCNSPIKQKRTIRKPVFNFDKIPLKSLQLGFQQKLFTVWANKDDVIITGGTGTGKTSQVPKILWWINYLFDGFEELDTFSIMSYRPIFRHTVLSLPRKVLIYENSRSVAKSLGFRTIKDSPIKCLFKDVHETEFANPEAKRFKTPFLFSINRLTTFKNVNTVILDEIHEHDTYADIAMAIVKKKKKDLRIRNLVLITATISDDLARLQEFLPNIKHLDIQSGTLYPIKELDFSHKCNFENNFINIEQIINEYATNPGESVLFFLPSMSILNKLEQRLSTHLSNNFFKIVLLSRFHMARNPNLLDEIKNETRRCVIILSTPIAESSLTLPNVKVVIDAGLFYSKSFFSGKIISVTQSMAEQRRGRVGRVSSGTYIKLYKPHQINLSFKKIDSEFLFPYIVNCLYYQISFDDLFIRPTDPQRFERMIDFFKQRGVDFYKKINDIFFLYNSYVFSLPEHLIIFLNYPHLAKYLVGLEDSDDKESYIRQHGPYLYTIAEIMNLKLKSIKDKFMIENFYEQISIFSANIVSVYNNRDCYLLSEGYAIR
ncbi:putative RNA helicase/nucleoside triphosphatase II [Diachasmimorpha longicaudata entomopoxvirus]|uniref:RNA helicase NPH-II n=1 Tax=Diachasmimorpha longicaudata entomopoxvirus TaxID=109981 RepID=A0A7R5WKA1_9POXV|nr:putative RNA helicase/nucleoside triphosphatase II [Diachasmimorpha longicaudata entomopoxvirus]AKS26451.1 putative RNA helicase/nucleoside triphosphatase II [Diachasmimorpha longicaudata entomopoxvirus]